MTKLCVVIFLTYLITFVYTASILDYFSLKSEGREKEDKKNCLCNGPSCICCIDFNISFIDLGGPGCVRLKYISPEEGIAVNVSYGDSLLHSETIKGPDPEPTCLNILGDLAHMCAHFSEILPTDDGLRGCLQLEPMLLGEVQVELPIGCFKMGSKGMNIIESSNDVIKQQKPTNEKVPEEPEESEEEESEENKPEKPGSILGGFTAEDILAAVNESAEEGISMITSWLGLGPINQHKNTTSSTNHIDSNLEPVKESTGGAE